MTRTRATGGGQPLKGERGYVLIMSALLMLPLLAFAGFAVDIGSWYTYANRMQRAADAAALAGVVWMPNDERAEQVALDTAKANGFDDAASRHHGHRHPGRQPAPPGPHHATPRCRMYFSRIFLSEVDIQRQALAEYVQAVPMGSPDNTLGNDPDRWNAAGYTQALLLAEHVRAQRPEGERRPPHGRASATPTRGARARRTWTTASDGYLYRLNVDTKPGQRQPRRCRSTTRRSSTRATSATPATCSTAATTTTPTYTTQVNTLVAQGHDRRRRPLLAGQHPVLRRRPGHQRRNVETTYIVRAPDNTPFDNLDNPVVCAKTFDAYSEEVVPAPQPDRRVPGRQHRPREHAPSTTTSASGPACARSRGRSVASATTSLQVRTNANLSSPPNSLLTADAAVTTGGYNRYSLRAGLRDAGLGHASPRA